VTPEIGDRISRLQGVLAWNIATEYDQRFTDAHTNLRKLDEVVELLKRQYTAFVRTRQAATQSYEGYDETIRQQRQQIRIALEKTQELMVRQGRMLEIMAVNELSKRRDRLDEFSVKARFALADSYDRANKNQLQKGGEQ
jgi:tRNA A37 N6-isopentenylltransferase MiaA